MIPLVFGLLVLVGGSNSSVIKFAVNEFPPVLLVALRAFIAFAVTAPFIIKTTRITLQKDTLQLFAVNMLFAANWLTFAIGLKNTSVTLSQLMYVPTSLIVALLSFLILKEKFTRVQITGLLITVVGASILAMESISKKSETFGDPFANLTILFGVFCWALYLVFSKKVANVYSPLTIIFYNFLVSFIVASVLVLVDPELRIFNFASVSSEGFLSILYVGIVSSAVYFYLNQWFVKHTSAFVASLQIYPLTIIATILGNIFYNEHITASIVISAILIMTGVFLATSYQYIKKMNAKN